MDRLAPPPGRGRGGVGAMAGPGRSEESGWGKSAPAAEVAARSHGARAGANSKLRPLSGHWRGHFRPRPSQVRFKSVGRHETGGELAKRIYFLFFLLTWRHKTNRLSRARVPLGLLRPRIRGRPGDVGVGNMAAPTEAQPASQPAGDRPAREKIDLLLQYKQPLGAHCFAAARKSLGAAH